ncbi:MAG: hypothetical protein R6W67_07935 [Bacteroidales bacterium]
MNQPLTRITEGNPDADQREEAKGSPQVILLPRQKKKPDAPASGFPLKALNISAGFLFSEASEACCCKRKKKKNRKVAKQPQGFFSGTRMLSERVNAFLLNQPQTRITEGNPAFDQKEEAKGSPQVIL